MLQPRRHGKRRKNGKDLTYSPVTGANGSFWGLVFADYLEDIVTATEIITENPNIFFNGTDAVLDYSSVTNEDNIEELKVFFISTVKNGESITIENGEYLDLMNLDQNTYDVGMTATFKNFDEDNLMVFLENVSVNNKSPLTNRYKKEFFLNNIKWTASSSTTLDSIKINQIVNTFGGGANSFANVLGEILPNDKITLQLDKSTNKIFTVIEYIVGEEGEERISVEEPVPEDTGSSYFGKEVFATLSRRFGETRNNEAACKNIENYGDCTQCSREIQGNCLSKCKTGPAGRDCKKSCRCQNAKDTINCWYSWKYKPKGTDPSTPGLNSYCAYDSDGRPKNQDMAAACDAIRANCGWDLNPNTPNLPLDDITPCICERCCEPQGLNDDPDCPWGCCGCCMEDPTRTKEDCDCLCSSRNMPPGEMKDYTSANKTTTPKSAVKNKKRLVGFRNTPNTKRNNQSVIENKHDDWKKSGSITIKVKIDFLNGNRVYTFSGNNQNTSARPMLILKAGQTIRFNTTEKALGKQGTHPLSFSTTPDGTHTNPDSELDQFIVRSPKKPGERGSYLYYTVPADPRYSTHYYFCKNHKGMGFRVEVGVEGSQRSNPPGLGGDEGPVIINPDVKPGTGPGGGGGVTGINECCDCDNCLMQAIMEVESGDWRNPGTKDPIEMCNARQPGNNGCGPYQIFPNFVQDARGLCPTPGIHVPNSPRVQACCGIPSDAHDTLCKDCAEGDTACCEQKKALSELIMACWKRKWTRNQGTGPCRCEGSGPAPVVDDEDCYTCEDLAKMHKEGRCGHQCCEKPTCCYQGPGANPAEGTDACNRAKIYWNKVKSVMCSIPACASCSDCGENPPSLEDKKRQERSMNTTTLPPRPTAPRTTTAPRRTTQRPMGGGYHSGY